MDTFDDQQSFRRDIFDHCGYWELTYFFKDDLISHTLHIGSANSLTLVHSEGSDGGVVNRRFHRFGHCLKVVVSYPNVVDIFPVLAEFENNQYPKGHPKITFEHQPGGSISGEYCVSSGQLIARVILDSEFKIINKQIHDRRVTLNERNHVSDLIGEF